MQLPSIIKKKIPKKIADLHILSRIGNLWSSIINIGVYAELPAWDKRRVRLLNGICTMGVVAQTWYVLSYTKPEERYIFWEAFQSAVFYLIPIVINYFRRYNLARHLFSIYNILNYSYMAITHGAVDGSEYFLLPSSFAATLFFRKTRVFIIYFILNFAFFWLCKYSFIAMKPLIVLPFDTYIPNQTLLFIVSFLVVLYFKNENVRQENQLQNKNEILEEEKQKSDNLLLNILPYDTAEELKLTGTAKSMYFDQVTVMFTDFYNFTKISEQMHPEELVSKINFYFSAFDTIISKYGIEKIKTIGDSYMCAAGLPKKNETHATDMTNAALEIMEFMRNDKNNQIAADQSYFDLRLGIHSGPIVAGIVGLKKFAYDIWGDTVNTASRMESSGEVGKINISKTTYELIKHNFTCIYRGNISVKSKGVVEMYYVEPAPPVRLIS